MTTETKPYYIEYHNDTGPDDEAFWEWWEVTNDSRTFRSNDEEDAKWLCAMLNQLQGEPL